MSQRLTMQDALERAEARLQMAGMICEPGERKPAQSAYYTCSGTDVLGPELMARVQLDMQELAEDWAESGNDLVQLPALVRGMLIREFWVGYEHGTVADV